jgi:hypothetical protein
VVEPLARPAAEVAKVPETLSQLLTRILSQLALSAWLPSAALTLLVVFILNLGSTLSDQDGPVSPNDAVSSAFSYMGDTSIGGLVLVVLLIIVLTIVTQAFSFESIRFLEGYWGVSRPCERLAQARAKHFRKVRRKLVGRYKQVTKEAWKRAKPRIERDPDFTPEMVGVLEAQVLMKECSIELTSSEEEIVDSRDWRRSVPGELLRRRTNLDKKLDDFPKKHHVMPTRLGNVLRHYEDATGYQTVESMIDETFDSLPNSLQLAHDEQRGRLDLYCSMQSVVVLAAAVAAFRFGYGYW